MVEWNMMLNELLADDSDTLTAREVEFTESLDKQRDLRGADWMPSSKRIAALERTWKRVFA